MGIKEFIVKNKATIISILSAVLSLAIGLSKIDLGAKVGIIVAILVVVIPVLLNVMTEGFSDKTVDLIVNAVSIIQQIILGVNAQPLKAADIPDGLAVDESEDFEDDVTEEEYKIVFTKEEIKELLLKGL